jgi:hypothetical protein
MSSNNISCHLWEKLTDEIGTELLGYVVKQHPQRARKIAG